MTQSREAVLTSNKKTVTEKNTSKLSEDLTAKTTGLQKNKLDIAANVPKVMFGNSEAFGILS